MPLERGLGCLATEAAPILSVRGQVPAPLGCVSIFAEKRKGPRTRDKPWHQPRGNGGISRGRKSTVVLFKKPRIHPHLKKTKSVGKF
jgi:hypothetical protein